MKKFCLNTAIISCLLISKLYSQELDNYIRVNQLGFYPNAPKIAVIVNDSIDTDFIIVDTKNSKVVFNGKLSAVHQSKNSSLITRIADFSSFNKTGNYLVIVVIKKFNPLELKKIE